MGVCMYVRVCACVCVCVCACLLSCVQHFVTLWITARQSPRSMGFSLQEYWNGLPFPPQRDLPNIFPTQGSNSHLPHLLHWQIDSLSLIHWGSPCLPMQETRVWSLNWDNPLVKEMATHSSILAWEIPWTEEPGRLYSPWSCKWVGNNLATKQQQQCVYIIYKYNGMLAIKNNKILPFLTMWMDLKGIMLSERI